MTNTSERIINQITKQTDLGQAEVREKVEQLTKSLCYRIDENKSSSDPTIPKLLAQELNVDLGDPTDYLYVILKFIKEPVRIYIYPFPTIDKDRINRAFRGISAQEIIDGAIKGWTMEPDEQFSLVFGREGIVLLFCVKSTQKTPDKSETATYSLNELINFQYQQSKYFIGFIKDILEEYSLNEIIKLARLTKVFTGYRIISIPAAGRAYIPLDVVEREILSKIDSILMEKKPWVAPRFPYISVESLKDQKEVDAIKMPFTGIIDVRGLEYLRNNDKIKQISIEENELRSFDFIALGHLPNLESISLYNNRIRQIDLSPLKDCKRLKSLELGYNRLQNIDLTPLQHCPKLEYFSIISNRLSSVDLTPLMNCKRLREVRLIDNPIEVFNLTPLLYCPTLTEVEVRDYPDGEEGKRRLPPLVNGPKALTIKGSRETDIIDLTGRAVHSELDISSESSEAISQIDDAPGLESSVTIMEKPEGYKDKHFKRVRKLLKKKKFKTLRKELAKNPDITFYSIKHVLYAKNPYTAEFKIELPKLAMNTLGFLSLLEGDLRALNLLREIIVNGDEIHPEVWEQALVKFQNCIENPAFSEMRPLLIKDVLVGRYRYMKLMEVMTHEACRSSDPLIPLLSNSDPIFRKIVFKFLIRPEGNMKMLLTYGYIAMRDPDRSVRETVRNELVKKMKVESVVDETLNKLQNMQEEPLDELVCSIYKKKAKD
ncbi:MAG: leucine-rich repeat domain-containing protein [Promethearchaeota archaeon]